MQGFGVGDRRIEADHMRPHTAEFLALVAAVDPFEVLGGPGEEGDALGGIEGGGGLEDALAGEFGGGGAEALAQEALGPGEVLLTQAIALGEGNGVGGGRLRGGISGHGC